VFAALEDPARARLYYLFAVAYALPSLRNGFSLDALSVACLLLGVAHVQVRPCLCALRNIPAKILAHMPARLSLCCGSRLLQRLVRRSIVWTAYCGVEWSPTGDWLWSPCLVMSAIKAPCARVVRSWSGWRRRRLSAWTCQQPPARARRRGATAWRFGPCLLTAHPAACWSWCSTLKQDCAGR